MTYPRPPMREFPTKHSYPRIRTIQRFTCRRYPLFKIQVIYIIYTCIIPKKVQKDTNIQPMNLKMQNKYKIPQLSDKVNSSNFSYPDLGNNLQSKYMINQTTITSKVLRVVKEDFFFFFQKRKKKTSAK